MTNRHIMLDLETFGTAKDACIVSIGACLFDPDTGYVPDPTQDNFACFHELIDLERTPAAELGRIDPSTVLWWLRQSDDARDSLANEANVRTPLREALSRFTRWLASNGSTPDNAREWRLWANDPDFDVALLTSAYDRTGQRFPLRYNSSRSMRTMKELAERYSIHPSPDSMPVSLVQHNALDDALSQARIVTHIIGALDARMVTPY